MHLVPSHGTTAHCPHIFLPNTMFHCQHLVVKNSDDLDKLSEGKGEVAGDGEIGTPCCSNQLVHKNAVSIVKNNNEVGLLKPGKRTCKMFA
jgi:hypothetical protein